MDPRYALFIWSCYGLAAVVVAWNLLAPRLARNELRRRLSERADEDAERSDEA